MFLKLLLLVSTVMLLQISAVGQACTPPEIVANRGNINIFTPEQETIFGDLIFENSSAEFRPLKDSGLNIYLNELGQKISKHLPDIGLKYQFHLVDLPIANAFNIPGGHVFVTRKLVAFSKDEDELAGVLAHELGHAVVRHGANDISLQIQKILKVDKLKDRADVVEKYNLLIERARTKRIRSKASHRNKKQMEADEIGLFAMVAAGYNPESFTSFFDRLTESKGKTGSWFSDLFGNTRPSEKRLREMIKAIKQLPAECRRGRTTEASNEFLKWQAQTASYRPTRRKVKLPGLLARKTLSPKLRTDVNNIAVTKNGKYLLVQDDYSVTIARRNPLKVLFQIPASQANRVNFTPDQEHVVFVTEDFRFEKWNIVEQKPVIIRELIIRGDCWEFGLSPNGEYIACIDRSMRIQILKTESAEKVWEQKKAFELSYFEFITWLGSFGSDSSTGSFFNIVFSPDSKHVVLSRSFRHRFRFKVNGMTAAQTENKVVALDLSTMKRTKIAKSLKKLTIRPFAFVANDKVLAMDPKDYRKSGVFSFPKGKRISKFTFGADEMKLTANPKYVILKPMENAKLGVFDMERGKVATAINKEDATIWGNQFIFEAASGKIMLREITYNEKEDRFEDGEKTETLEIPASSLGSLYAAEVSPNFKWLAFSAKTRGGIWDLNSGERKMFVRGFRGAIVADDGASVAAFPEKDKVKHSLALLNANNNETRILSNLPERGARQYGRFVLMRKSLEEKKSKSEEKPSLSRNVKFEIQDIITKKTIWSESFPKTAPRYFFDEFSGRVIFIWRVGAKSGQEKLSQYPEIEAKSKTLKNDEENFFVQVVDAFADGKVIGQLLVETGNRSFSIANGLSERNWLTLYDTEGRVLVYKIKEGKLHQRFFGHDAAINPVGNQIIIENYPGEVSLYDFESGESQANLIFDDNVAFMRFSLNGKALFVLTDSQTVYFFDVEKLLKNQSGVVP